MTIQPHDAFTIVRPDEVAECWDGIDADLYRLLWGFVNDYKAPSPEVSEEPCYGMDCVADFWDRIPDEAKLALNAAAEAQDAGWNDYQPDEAQEWYDFDPDC